MRPVSTPPQASASTTQDDRQQKPDAISSAEWDELRAEFRAELAKVQEAQAALRATLDGVSGVVHALHHTLHQPRKRLQLPVPAWLRKVKRTVRRPTLTLHPVPVSDIRPRPSAPGHWESTGPQPAFELIPSAHGCPSQWVHLELEFRADDAPGFAPRLLINRGAGYKTEVQLPAPEQGRISCILHLGQGNHGIRFVPFDRPGPFTLKNLHVQVLTPAEGAARLVAGVLREDRDKLPEVREFLKERVAQASGGLLSRIKTGLVDLAARTPTEPIGYPEWVQRYEQLTEADREAMRKHYERLPWKPLVSIIIPAQEGEDASESKRALESVLQQVCGAWEVWVVSARGKPAVGASGTSDMRVRTAASLKNALRGCRGEFVAFLDPAALLAEHAVYLSSVALNGRPDTNVLYSDEDSLDAQGQRTEPRFNVSWDPDRFFEYPFPLGFALFRKQLVEEAFEARGARGTPKARELITRCMATAGTSDVRHLPRVLCHWRLSAEEQAERWAEETVSARQECVQALYPAAEVSSDEDGALRIRHALPATRPLVSIIIPTRDGYNVLRPCVESILEKTRYREYEILIVDNQSEDEITLSYLHSLERQGHARVLRYPYPFNYSSINNFAARHARGSLIALLNDDIEVISGDWLEEMVRHALRPEVGAVGARLLYPDGRLQHCGVTLGIGGVAGHLHRLAEDGALARTRYTHQVSAVTAACLLVRSEVFQAVGGLDERHLSVAFNDVDLCLRIGALGLRNLWVPHALLYHHESVSRGSDETAAQKRRFSGEVQYMMKRWGSVLPKDPFHSPNLSLDTTDSELAWPPRVRSPWHSKRSTK